MESAERPTEWEQNATGRALDQLFSSALRYRRSDEFLDLLTFVCAFGTYARYNSMLLHIQMAGAVFVAPAPRWMHDYHRRAKPNGPPLVILQPMGPVMFVFDVGDAEPVDEHATLPRAVESPFEPRSGSVDRDLNLTMRNVAREGGGLA